MVGLVSFSGCKAGEERERERDLYPGDGERADEEVGERNDGFRDRLVAIDDPGDGGKGAGFGELASAVGGFESADDEEESHHAEGAEEEGGPTAPFVEEEDCGQGQGHVEDVLDGCGQQRVADAGGFHDIDDIVHPVE